MTSGASPEPDSPWRQLAGDASDEQVVEALQEMIRRPEYPCVGAKSVVNRHSAEIAVFPRLADPDSTAALHARLAVFLSAARPPGQFASFIAAFRAPVPSSEAEFERSLWQQLELLHERDDREWDPTVSNDPESPHYCFSLAGSAAFVIGMHPRASRLARRTSLPVLVFNPHAQFEALRAAGGYDRMRDTIRRRDAALQGSINPMVSDHGGGSEARQYSGREVGPSWRAPRL